MNNRLSKYKSPGAKRLMLEAQELKDNTEDYCAQPIDDNLFEWHFTVRGPPDTAFGGGYYHGRLSFPGDYPMKPPSIILLTPNGRFEINKKICLSISGHHPETWQPSWSVRTALLALIAFMPTKAKGAIGSLDFSDAERRRLAAESRTWRCETCGLIKNLLVHPDSLIERTDPTIDYCKAGTSIMRVESNDNESDRQSSRSINSSGGSRDSSPDSKGEKQNDYSCTYSTDTQQNSNPPSDTETNQLEIQSSPSHSSNYYHEQDNREDTQNLADRRRSYPPLVLKSIFILLSLLILRRVVMVIQL